MSSKLYVLIKDTRGIFPQLSLEGECNLNQPVKKALKYIEVMLQVVSRDPLATGHASWRIRCQVLCAAKSYPSFLVAPTPKNPTHLKWLGRLDGWKSDCNHLKVVNCGAAIHVSSSRALGLLAVHTNAHETYHSRSYNLVGVLGAWQGSVHDASRGVDNKQFLVLWGLDACGMKPFIPNLQYLVMWQSNFSNWILAFQVSIAQIPFILSQVFNLRKTAQSTCPQSPRSISPKSHIESHALFVINRWLT